MNESIPYIKLEDKINASILDQQPALIVEGKDDIYVYGHLLVFSNIDWDNVDLVIGDGRKQIIDGHKNGLPFKYVAVVDADYDYFKACCLDDPQLIYTHFCSIENYLTRSEVVGQTIYDLRTFGCTNITAEDVINRAIEAIEPLVVACLAKITEHWPIKIEDYGLENESWWNKREEKVDKDKMYRYLQKTLASKGISLSHEEWQQIYSSVVEDIMLKNPSDLIIRGKYKFDAVYYQIKRALPRPMSTRNKKGFGVDLCKNLLLCPQVKNLLQTIDERINVYCHN